MSANRSIRSDGQPYFAMVQRSVAFMDAGNLSPAGVYEAQIDVRIFANAERLASDDELHPLFSFSEEHPSGAALFEFGVTPSGMVKFIDASGAVLATPSGTISPDGRFHSIKVYNDPGITYASLVVDGFQYESSAMGGTFAVPTGGRYGRIMLFNGISGITRVEAAIRSAWVAYFDSTSRIQAWPFSEHAGPTVTPVLSEAASDPRNLVLTASEGWFAQTQFPWGPLAGTGVEGRYRWDVATEYRKRSMPKTTYRKVVVEP